MGLGTGEDMVVLTTILMMDSRSFEKSEKSRVGREGSFRKLVIGRTSSANFAQRGGNDACEVS